MTIKNPKLETIKVKDLHIDPHTQRSWDEKWSKKMKDNFDEDKLGIFRVSRRTDGLNYVIDGQHRHHMLVDLKWDVDGHTVQSLVYEGLTLREEAELFLAFNIETRKPTSIDGYRLSVVAEEPWALDIERVLDKHGLRVGFSMGGNDIAAIGALRVLYDRGGHRLVDEVLTIIEQAWGASDRDARDGSILKGVGHVLLHNDSIDRHSLADKLGKAERPGQLLGRARTYKAATGRSLWMETAHVVVAHYNKGRSTRKVAV